MAKARQQYFADETTLQKESREFAIEPEIIEKLDSIEEWAQVNVIERVLVNWTPLEPDNLKWVNVEVPLVEDSLYSTSPVDALSAKQGRILYEYIQNIQSRGRYLSNWNAATWLAVTNPTDNPYDYRAWDYYIVSNVAAQGWTNYRPNWAQYIIWQASITVETETVKISDSYIYDGTNWVLLINTEREIAVDSSLSTESTNPVENRVVTNALNWKQATLTAWTNIQINNNVISATDTTYPNLPAASGWLDDSLVTTWDKYTWWNKQDTLIAWNNISIWVDGKTISAVDTTYSNLPAAQWGTNVSLVTTWDKYTWDNKQDELIAWSNIQIASDWKTISATDTTYTAWTGISISSGNVITNTATTFKPFPAEFDTTHTTEDFLDSIEALNLPVGSAYLWQISVSDMPHWVTVQWDVEVYVYPQNVIYSIMRSAEIEPYQWEVNSYQYRGWEPIANITKMATTPSNATEGMLWYDDTNNVYKYYDWTNWHTIANPYTAWTNVQINNNVISATDTTYSAWTNITIDANNEISATDTTYSAGANITIDANNEISATDTTYSAWTNVNIDSNNVISATDTTYTAWANVQISNNNVISATDSKATWWNISWTLTDQTDLNTALGWKQDTLIAGTNIQIDVDGKTISATDTTYTAGTWISIDSNNVISNTQTSAERWNITWTLSDQTDLNTALGNKQDTLIAWTNISIASDGKTISATDTTYTAGTWIDITNWVISNTQTSAEWWNITWTLADQTDLKTELDKKMENLVFLSYGISTWADFVAAYGKNVYCRASSNSNPAQWDQTRCAFMAYINNPNINSATEVEFQYYRSVSSHSASQQWDQVFVYKLNKNTWWSVTTREASSKIVAWTNMSSSYSNGTLTLNATDTTYSTATSSTAWLVKLWSDMQQTEATQSPSSTAWRTYPVQLNSSNQMVVNVPWEDTTTWSATSTAAGTVKLFSDTQQTETAQSVSSTANRTYWIQNNSSNQMVVNVPWTDTTYSAWTYLTINWTTFDVDTSLIATKTDLANFAGFQVVATLPTTDIKTNIIYLLWPVGSGADKYEEYIYSNNTWIMIWDTSIDLSPYFDKNNDDSDDITEWSTNLFLTSTERTKLWNTSGTNSWDETKTTIQTKLWAATTSNDGYLTSTDWNTFNWKANASDLNTKTFYLSNINDLTTATAALQWHFSGKNAIIVYSWYAYTIWTSSSSSPIVFISTIARSPSSSLTKNWIKNLQIFFDSSHNATVIHDSTKLNEQGFIETDYNYSTPYTPTYAGSPATKKYVDDNVVQKSATAPSSPTEWMVWYDTTNDVLKVYDGTNWNEVWSWGAWDMLYQDFNWVTKTWATITLDFNSVIEPSANFTVNAPSTIKDWQIYILRVESGATAYTMTLGTWITNPYSESTTLTANKIKLFTFLAIDGDLELQPSISPVDISGKQDKATSWTSAPATTPTYVWQEYIKTNDKKLYIATGTTSSTDWTLVWWDIQLAPNSPLTPKYLWYWTQAQYEALSQYYTDEANDTVYFTI